MSTYGGSVPWWRVVRADGSLPPSHDEEARAHYLEEGTPLRGLRADGHGAGVLRRLPPLRPARAPARAPGSYPCSVSLPATADLPVTVSITRHVEPDRVDQMIAWVRAGSALAERFPGFLGTGWVRPSADSDEWHMLYRFDSAALAGRVGGLGPADWWLRLGPGAGGGVAARAPDRHRGLVRRARSSTTSRTSGRCRRRRRGGSRR